MCDAAVCPGLRKPPCLGAEPNCGTIVFRFFDIGLPLKVTTSVARYSLDRQAYERGVDFGI